MEFFGPANYSNPGSTCCKHGVQKQDPTVGDIFRELIVEQSRLARVLITLDEYLSNANRAAAVAQALLHRFTCAHDRDTTYFALELYASIRATYRCCDGTLDSGKMIQSFLYQQADNAVGVEYEVRPDCVPIPYHARVIYI